MVGMKEKPALRRKFPFVYVFMPLSDTAPLLDVLHTRGLFADLRADEARESARRETPCRMMRISRCPYASMAA